MNACECSLNRKNPVKPQTVTTIRKLHSNELSSICINLILIIIHQTTRKLTNVVVKHNHLKDGLTVWYFTTDKQSDYSSNEDFNLIPCNLQKVAVITKTCLMKTKTLNRWKVNQCYNKMITFPRPTRPSGIKVVSLKRRKINKNEM